MPAFEPILFLLAVLTSAACMVFLFRGYSRTGARLLFWSGLCFVFLTINNVLLFFDLVVYPTSLDLRIYRAIGALCGVVCLLYAFIWEAE